MDISRRPHDKFFRAYFSDPGILADLIRFVLPAEVVAALDLSTLRIDGGTYIDRGLREHFSDIAASVALAPAQQAVGAPPRLCYTTTVPVCSGGP